MRLPYVENPPKFDNEQDQAIVERVKERRGDIGLLELDLALLHTPPVADGWNTYLGAIRTRTSLSTSIKELAITRVAVLNRAWYEWSQHAPPLLECEGITDAHITSILKTPARQSPDKSEIWDEQHAAALAYTDAMTLDVSVPDDVFKSVKKCFSDKEVVELTATIAAYNCVSRFLVALDVGEKNGMEGTWPLEGST